jgi:hypothetical protein
MKKTIVFTIVCSIFFVVAQRISVGATDTSADLSAAIKSGDMTRVSEVLSAEGQPDAPFEGGVTALIGAALLGHEEIVKLLLDKGASVNARSDAGLSALMVASAYGHKEIVKLLLDKGADADVREQGGRNAFLMAVGNGHAEVAEVLRPHTKGASSMRIKTVIGPMEANQKCLPVRKSPDETSDKVACLKAGMEVTSKGESGDHKWAALEKPVSGWVPADKLNDPRLCRGSFNLSIQTDIIELVAKLTFASVTC